MDRREAWSLVISFVIALLIMGLIVYLLGWSPRVAAYDGPANGSEAAGEIAVLIDLPSQDGPGAEDGGPPPKPGKAPGEAPGSLATRQEGKDLQQPPAPDTLVQSPVQEPETMPEPPEEVESPESEDSAPQEKTPDKKPLADAQKPPTAPQAAGVDDREQMTLLTLRGRIPPLRYTGATRQLLQEYPRIEMVWILDREPGGRNDPDDPPRVMLEVVADSAGSLHWRNARTREKSTGFEYVTMRHVLDERIRVAQPERLQLGRDPAKLLQALQAAGLGRVSPSRMQWGYYRHRAEVSKLGRAASAFARAQEAGKLDFQPRRRDFLEVHWTVGPSGEPAVGALRFHPEVGRVAEIPLD